MSKTITHFKMANQQLWPSSSGRTRLAAAGLAAAVLLSMAAPAAAQSPSGGSGREEIFVGSELESYLRVLQLHGRSELYPWSIRSFSPGEVDRIMPGDSAHPWAGRYGFGRDTAAPAARVGIVSPRATATFNSAFPFGYNDGPIWAGRGVTTAIQGGVSARFGPASLVVAPVLFYSQNASFELAENGRTGRLRFADPISPDNIDLPQRFGDAAVARVDPGQSTLRVDLAGVATGVSTANQYWGPAVEHPIVLGSNAPGFLHAFIGTSAPVDLWIGKIHGRMVWGKLDQSEYSPVEGHKSRRIMSGLVAVFTPRGIPGLEIGGSRFFHRSWPENGLGAEDLLMPFESLYRYRDSSTEDPDTVNQLASVFARWVLPRSGFEVYGEFGKEDRNVDFRDVLLEPEHNGAYLLGFRKSWMRSPSQMLGLRGEALNAQVSHVARVRHQSPLYLHGSVLQGHTQRGQLLGSAWGHGGAAATLAVDYYHTRGRWTVDLSRLMRAERLPQESLYWESGSRDPNTLDLIHSGGIEALFFVRRFDLLAGLRGIYNTNRDFGSNVFNLNASFGIRAGI